jgi:hypothetical protein
VRRDNVEHLLMIGGPSDIVIEQNIVRAVPAPGPRDSLRSPTVVESMTKPPEPGVPPPRADLPRPEPRTRPEPIPRPEPVPRPEPIPRPEPAARSEPPGPSEPAAGPEPVPRAAPVPRPEPPPRAEPVTRAEPVPLPRTEPVRRMEAAPRPERVPRGEPPTRPGPTALPEPPVSLPRVRPRNEPPARPPRIVEPRPLPAAQAPNADQLDDDIPAIVRAPPSTSPVPRAGAEPAPAAKARSSRPPGSDRELSEMAQRLDAVLRRPIHVAPDREGAGPNTTPAGEPDSRPTAPLPSSGSGPPHEPQRAETIRPASFGRPGPEPRPEPPRPAPEPARSSPPDPTSPSAKSVFDSLEQEMASLLGRPIGKE